jgi:single-stranded-DNA-specific exonuclease
MKYEVKVLKPDKELYNRHYEYTKDYYLATILANRGILDKLPNVYTKLKEPSYFFKEVSKMANYLDNLLKTDPNSLIIHNDFDNDGFSGAFILKAFIKEKYGVDIDVYTNSRKQGYEMTKDIVDILYDNGNKKTIITIDKGISSYEGIDYAKSLGMTVLVTDHHEPKLDDKGNKRISNADYIMCHTIEDIDEGICDLSGGATVWYLCREIDDNLAMKYVDVAGISTVVDFVRLNNLENRKIVLKSLTNIRNNQFSNSGYGMFIKATANKDLPLINTTDYGFIFGPIINALCRYDHSANYLNRMLADNYSYEDIEFAISLNEKRKLEINESLSFLKDNIVESEDFVIVKSSDISSNLAGLIASKFMSQYNKTVFVFYENKIDGICKGSARSATYNLQECFTDKYSCDIKGGGHKAAAGLEIPCDQFNLFIEELNKYVVSKPTYDVDFSIDSSNINDIDIDRITKFNELEPYGASFKSPTFLITLSEDMLSDIKVLKELHLSFKLNNVKFIGFNIDFDMVDINKLHKYNIIGSFDINEFRGNRSTQVIIENILKKEDIIIN